MNAPGKTSLQVQLRYPNFFDKKILLKISFSLHMMYQRWITIQFGNWKRFWARVGFEPWYPVNEFYTPTTSPISNGNFGRVKVLCQQANTFQLSLVVLGGNCWKVFLEYSSNAKIFLFPKKTKNINQRGTFKIYDFWSLSIDYTRY